MAQEKITAKQQEILEYIKETILKKGYPPAVREICEAVHLKSTSSVHSHLETLEEKGYIRRDPTKPRTIEIIDDCFNLTRRVELLPNAETFMLNVKGNSMINAGIFDGDQLIVERCSTAYDGEIVVALVDDSATVKRFYKEDGYYRLQPENDEMDPIIVDHLEILGKVIGLFRLGIN